MDSKCGIIRVRNLSKIIDIIVGVGVPAQRGHEALALDDGDVFIVEDDGHEWVVLNVKVLFVVELLHFVLIHLEVVRVAVIAVVIVDAG